MKKGKWNWKQAHWLKENIEEDFQFKNSCAKNSTKTQRIFIVFKSLTLDWQSTLLKEETLIQHCFKKRTLLRKTLWVNVTALKTVMEKKKTGKEDFASRPLRWNIARTPVEKRGPCLKAWEGDWGVKICWREDQNLNQVPKGNHALWC